MVMKRFFPSTIKPLVLLPFISTWRTTNTSVGSSANNQVKLPLVSTGTYNFVVNWGDGSEDTITVWNQAQTTHTYAATGDYTITITGVITGWAFGGTGDRLKILDIAQWGSIQFLSVNNVSFGAFYLCSNLNVSATDQLILSGSQFAFFRNCSSLVGNASFNNWDVSGVTGMYLFFGACTSFNQNIGSWDVSNCTNFRSMFESATAFNQNLSSWNMSNATQILAMFRMASAFNNGGDSGINNWDVSNVTSLSGNNAGIFEEALAFNQPLNNWDVSNVSDFRGCFQFASAFNQPLNNWDVSAATNMISMFRGATAFNQDIGSWDVSNVSLFQTFMNIKTFLNYSSANLNSIYNGWTNKILNPLLNIDFGTIKYTAAATAARALLTRANSTVTVTNAVNNGSGLIRITTGAAHGRTTGDKIFISGVVGTTEANGGWIVTVIDATTVDLQASTFTNTYVSGGTFRIGYGWTITDGGL